MSSYQELHTFYTEHLTSQILPYWKKAIDFESGGVFTGFDPLGKELLNQDKYTWSQGRFLWLWSKLAEMCKTGMLKDDADAYFLHAKKTYEFIKKNAFLSNGNCIFLLSKDGLPKEMVAGEGYDTSFYADCFVVMGCAEYGRVFRDQEALDLACQLYSAIESRIEAGTVRSEPYPIPKGYDAHGFAMIMLNTSQVVAKAVEEVNGLHSSFYRERAWHYVNHILTRFCDQEHRIREIMPSISSDLDHAGSEAKLAEETLLVRHLNPGHTIECMWFILEEAALHKDKEVIHQAVTSMKCALKIGWDTEFGGLLRFVDLEGGQPKGKGIPEGKRFEKLIRTTWDTKLWWPHSEALYTSLLAYDLTGDVACMEWYKLLHDYTFNIFPADEGQEWIQIRNRAGIPVEQVVALPVKDPYHIMRNVIMMIELTASRHNNAI